MLRVLIDRSIIACDFTSALSHIDRALSMIKKDVDTPDAWVYLSLKKVRALSEDIIS